MPIPNFHIEAARTRLGPLARQNLFLFEIPGINFLGGNYYDDIVFSAEAASVPGFSTETQLVPWMNSEYKIPGAVKYENFDVTFRISENFRVYDILTKWAYKIYDPRTGVCAAPDELILDARVTLLSWQGARMRTWLIHGMYPENIQNVTLDRGDSTPQKASVTFAYGFWELDSVGSGAMGRLTASLGLK